MRVLVSSAGSDERSPVDPRFGRASHFLIFDSSDGGWEAHPNPAADLAHGAGIEAARFAIEHGVEAVITGHAGPNAFKTLSAASIHVFTVSDGLVCDALEKLKADALPKATEASASAPAERHDRRTAP